MNLKCSNLSKNYNSKLIFKNLSFEISSPRTIAITGSNGSGKSTLIKILANLIKPSSGSFEFSVSEKIIPSENIYKFTGLIAPYLSLYDELTGYENLLLFYNLKTGINKPTAGKNEIINSYFEKLDLTKAKNELVKNYSSGMKQRLKFAFAIMNNPTVLLLDEPTSNLDSKGVSVFFEIINSLKNEKLIIIATNDDNEKSICDSNINIEDYK